MFEVAIYTDTRAHEALDGIDGFNFQAASPGMTAQYRDVVKEYCLHRIVDSWSIDHDPLDHPPTFVYRRQGELCVVARGISTGRTSNGRPGNILTQAAATTDPDDFAGLRPAQLFGAANWCLAAAETRVLQPWVTPLEIDPRFTAEGLAALVHEEPWARESLPAILTMVEQLTDEEPRRLVLITRDALLAQRWIALCSLFLSDETARRISIRGLVKDPLTTRADIVAASPDLGEQPDPSVPRSRVNVIDLDAGAVSPVTPTRTATAHAQLFLGHDVTTALSAIDLARRWESVMTDEVAVAAAGLAASPPQRTTGEEWAAAMEALRALAAAGHDDELLFYGDTLVDTCVTRPLSTESDAAAAGATLSALVTAGAHELATVLLLHALESLEPTDGRFAAWVRAVAESAGRLVWPSDQAQAQADAAECLGRLTTLAGPSLLPSCLTASQTLSLPLPGRCRGPAVARLAQWWSLHPQAPVAPDRWHEGAEVVEALAAALIEHWGANEAAALADLRAGSWDWLLRDEATDPRTRHRLRGWHDAAGLAAVDLPRREAHLASLTPLLPETWPLVLSGASIPEHAGLVTAWVTATREIPHDAGEVLLRQLHGAAQQGVPVIGTRPLLRLVADPATRVDHAELRLFAQDVTHGARVLERACGEQRVPSANLREARKYVGPYAPFLVDLTGEAVLTSADRRGAQNLVHEDEEWAARGVKQQLDTGLTDLEATARCVGAAVLLLGEPSLPLQDAARTFIAKVGRSRKLLAAVTRARDAGRLTPETAAAFDSAVETAGADRAGRFLPLGLHRSRRSSRGAQP